MGQSIYSFYKFISLKSQKIQELTSVLRLKATELNIFGLMILSEEGVNSTITGDLKNLKLFRTFLESEFGELYIKESTSDRLVFRRFKVVERPEIVTLGIANLQPTGKHNHLSPKEWEAALNEAGVVVVDTRNWYETKIGKFKNAVELGIEEFQQFPKAIEKLNLKKDQKVLMYCTGGIRCEKAILAMKQQGFNNVYQLEGGILKYLEKQPNKSWQGECFVFDHRVAVDQNLRPSCNFHLCPHCGQPSDMSLACIRCESPAHPCSDCLKKGDHFSSCSKNCAHHYKVRPKKGRRQIREGGADKVKSY